MIRRDHRSARALGAPAAAIVLVLGAAALPAQVLAQVPAATGESPDLPTKLYDYGDWQALVAGSGETRSCYATLRTLPAPQEGRAKDRPLLYVTHRPGKNAFNVVAFFAAYDVKPGSDIELDFGFAKFRLFTQTGSNGAWAPNADADGRIVEAMKTGWTVTVRGTSAAGAEIADTLSLSGFTAAQWRISQECPAR